MRIIDAVTCSILSIHELRDERYSRDENIKYAYYSIFYLVREVCIEFGISKQDITVNMESLGYEPQEARRIVDKYETWAKKIKITETASSTKDC